MAAVEPVSRSEVLVVGCGPTGVVLANLLGRLGVRTTVLERDADVPEFPRATHVDEETLRCLQSTALGPALLEHTAPFGRASVVDARGRVLFDEEVKNRRGVHGYEGSRFFDQAAFERVLRSGLARFPEVVTHLGVAVESIVDRGDHVEVVARTAAGQPQMHVARWVVGCDGGRSVTRESLGVTMDSLAPPRRWVLVDTRLKDPADAALLPSGFRYVLDPRRLTIYAHGIGLNRRWEFETCEQDPDDATVVGWIAPFIDPARLEILRLARYSRLALLAPRWRAGRVLLAGDAAHMMPPSAGQGLCSGVRDAVNLAWKLERVVHGRAGAGLLDSYERERRSHARGTLDRTLFLARRLEADSAAQRVWRGLSLRAIGALSPLRSLLGHLLSPPQSVDVGCFDGRSPLAGRHLPQTALRDRAHGEDPWLVDAIGYRPALIFGAAVAPPSPSTIAWAAARGLAVGRLGDDLVEAQSHLADWLRAHGADVVLVRPDRLIYGAARTRELDSLLGSWDAAAA